MLGPVAAAVGAAWSRLLFFPGACLRSAQMDMHRETCIYELLCVSAGSERCRPVGATQTHTDAVQGAFITLGMDVGMGICRRACSRMQMQPADADALTTLYAHNLAVSPLDLAVWPGHDGECRCRVQAGHVPPGPSGWPSLALSVLLDDIHPQTHTLPSLTWLTGLYTIRGW